MHRLAYKFTKFSWGDTSAPFRTHFQHASLQVKWQSWAITYMPLRLTYSFTHSIHYTTMWAPGKWRFHCTSDDVFTSVFLLTMSRRSSRI